MDEQQQAGPDLEEQLVVVVAHAHEQVQLGEGQHVTHQLGGGSLDQALIHHILEIFHLLWVRTSCPVGLEVVMEAAKCPQLAALQGGCTLADIAGKLAAVLADPEVGVGNAEVSN